jgi:hypothetical protein
LAWDLLNLLFEDDMSDGQFIESENAEGPEREANSSGAGISGNGGAGESGAPASGDQTSEPAGEEKPGADPEAPWGRKADGTPRRKPGAKKRDGADESTSEGETVVGVVAGSSSSGPEPAAKEAARTARRERLTSVSPKPGAAQAPRGPSLPIGVDYPSLGKDAAFLFVGVGQMIFGEDWAPEHDAEGNFTQDGRSEMIALRDSFAAYFKKKQVADIPAEWALVVTLGAYAAKRATRPTVKARFKAMGSWAIGQVRRARGLFVRS